MPRNSKSKSFNKSLEFENTGVCWIAKDDNHKYVITYYEAPTGAGQALYVLPLNYLLCPSEETINHWHEDKQIIKKIALKGEDKNAEKYHQAVERLTALANQISEIEWLISALANNIKGIRQVGFGRTFEYAGIELRNATSLSSVFVDQAKRLNEQLESVAKSIVS